MSHSAFWRSARWVPGQDHARAWTVFSAIAAVLVVGWAIVILVDPALRFAVNGPDARSGVEAASALARLFAALVLLLFPIERSRQRLYWVAAGLVVLALGSLFFGYIESLAGYPTPVNLSTYQWLGVSILAGIFFAVGLVTPSPPRFTRWVAIAGIALFALLGILTTVAHRLPPLIHGSSLVAGAARTHAVYPGLTAAYWLLFAIPLLLTLLAALGALRQTRRTGAGGWLLAALILLAGSEIHSLFWPSVYSPLLSTADVLRLAFSIVVTTGAAVELRNIAARRAVLLSTEQEHTRRLTELSEMKESFTSMVVHELGSPLAAIRRIVELGQTGKVDALRALESIGAETALLANLMEDMNATGRVESPEFQVYLQSVPVAALVADAEAFARTLPGRHPVTAAVSTEGRVLADRDRIGQVLRNLLGNAAKYSEPGTPIELRVSADEPGVCIAVVDRGPGIAAADRERIFEKFGRGTGQKAPGTGLGLYLSRRIVNAHGSDLTLVSEPGDGAEFAFELARAPEREVAGPVPIDLLLLDDHAAFRQPLAMLLDQEEHVHVVAQAGTVEEARQSLAGVNVALVDLDLPDGSGIELIAELTEHHPEIRTIVLTGSVDRRQIAGAVEAGAGAVVHKAAPIEEVRDVLQRVARGENLAQQSGIVDLLQNVRKEREEEREAERALEQLTPREREVLQALAQGLSDKEIAAQLHITPATARTHVVRILSKLGVSSRLQAVLFASRHGAVDTAPERDSRPS